jgi:endonuclease/exonuclease/phosphatase family metal-dependent hydrolase
MNVYGQKDEWGDGYCEERLKKTGEFIADANPSYTIVGLTEVHPDYVKITCDGHALVEGIQKNGDYGAGKHRWGHPETSWKYYDGGLALFSTSEFDWEPYDEHVHKYSFNPKSRTTSGFIFTQIQITNSITIDVYITHLHSKKGVIADCDRNCRYQELEELAKGIHDRSELSGNPVLVMGDFNIGGPNPDPYNCDGNCGYGDIMDVLRNPRDLWSERTNPTAPGSTHNGQRIDYMFVMTDPFFSNSEYEIFLSGRERIRIVDWEMDSGEPVSDHLGLSATLEIREKIKLPPECPPPIRPNPYPQEGEVIFKQIVPKKEK